MTYNLRITFFFVPLQQIFDFGCKKRYSDVADASRMGTAVGRTADLAARPDRLGSDPRRDHSHL